jgi:hypothetical protein
LTNFQAQAEGMTSPIIIDRLVAEMLGEQERG